MSAAVENAPVAAQPEAQVEAPKPADAEVAANNQAVADNAAVEAPKPAEADVAANAQAAAANSAVEVAKPLVVDINSQEQFVELLKSHSYVALQAHASWCGPCKVMVPFFNNQAKSHLDIEQSFAFARVDIDDVPKVAETLGITTIPAFYFFDQDVQPTEDQKKENIEYVAADQCKGAIPPPLAKLIGAYAEKAKNKTVSNAH
jgi:thioredoxin 1